jgi:D-glycero-D-manno-heptose 1,7-bisphosphate phosphatase
MNKAIFLDKDGTLITDIPYNINRERITLEKNVAEALYKFQQDNYLLIVISNQAGIALGYFTEEQLCLAHEALRDLLSHYSVKLTAIYYCPHHPESRIEKLRIPCDCRKPLPGLLVKAAKEFDVDLSQSWMIGDILHDVEAGNRAGCRTILIANGNETEWEMNEWRRPCFQVTNMEEAADLILTSA